MFDKKTVVVFGTGKIGSDLILKFIKLSLPLNLIVIGRRKESSGIEIASKHSIEFHTDGMNSLAEILKSRKIDYLIDASSAETHEMILDILDSNQKISIIDLTPSKKSKSFVLGIDKLTTKNFNIGLISCGAQVSIPPLITISNFYPIEYVEIVTSLSSKSVGIATRDNLDDYIYKTEEAIVHYAGSSRAKAILIVNPAKPEIPMNISLYLKFRNNLTVDTKDIDTILQNKSLSGFFDEFSFNALYFNVNIFILS
jgi:acetaldehyde dehydrogenase